MRDRLEVRKDVSVKKGRSQHKGRVENEGLQRKKSTFSVGQFVMTHRQYKLACGRCSGASPLQTGEWDIFSKIAKYESYNFTNFLTMLLFILIK